MLKRWNVYAVALNALSGREVTRVLMSSHWTKKSAGKWVAQYGELTNPNEFVDIMYVVEKH